MAIVANGDGVLFSDDPDQQVAEIGEYVQLELESGRKNGDPDSCGGKCYSGTAV